MKIFDHRHSLLQRWPVKFPGKPMVPRTALTEGSRGGPRINDDIVLVAAVDVDGAEREFVETHRRTP
jgi:hypothetical protein